MRESAAVVPSEARSIAEIIPFRLTREFALVFGLTLSLAGAAGACYEPSAPYCAGQYGRFDSDDDFQSCRREMESYQSDVETYVTCQKSEIESLQSEADDLAAKAKQAINDHSDAVDTFNQRARQ